MFRRRLPTVHAMSLLPAHLAWERHRGLRPDTLVSRRRAVVRLARRLEVDVDTTVAAGRADLEAWWAGLTSGLAARTTELMHVRGWYRWAMHAGHRGDDPTVTIHRPRLPRRLPRPIGETDLALAVATAPERVRPWLILAGWAGLRAGEVARLRAEDVTPERLRVVDGKGGRDRTVPAHPLVLAEVEGLPARGWLFPRRDGQGGHTPPIVVTQLSSRHFRSLGMPWTLHSLRHRFATGIYRETHDLLLTGDLLGHASPNTTAGYAAHDPARGAPAVLALPSV